MHCYKSQEVFPILRVRKDTGKVPVRLFYENTNEKFCILLEKKILIVKYSTGKNRFQQNGKQKSGRLYLFLFYVDIVDILC